MRRLNSDFTTKFLSEAGTKNINKDYFGFVTLDKYACWVIAETYDNDTEIISAKLAVETVLDMFTKKPTMSKNKIKKYIKEANNQLKEQSDKFQLKASILVVVTDYTKMRYALCGNCRLHIFRGNNIWIKSEDQTLYQQMIKDELVADNGEKGIEESRNLFYFLGKEGRIRIFASRKMKMQDEDIVLMTTWGLWERITTIEMIDALENVKNATDYVDELQDLFLSKQEKNVNNYTLASVFINKVFVPKETKKKLIKIGLSILSAVIVILIIIIIYAVIKDIKRKQIVNAVKVYEVKGDNYVDDSSFDRAIVEYDNSFKESKDLKDIKGKYGIENNEIKDRIAAKQRVTQLLIDANKFFDDKKYENAIRDYKKALLEGKGNMDFYDIIDIDSINSKIDTCEKYEHINRVITIGSSQADLEQFDEALITLGEAKELSIEHKNKDFENEIRLKMSEINLKKAEKEKKIKEDEKAKEDEKIAKELAEETAIKEKEALETEKLKQKEEKEVAEKIKTGGLLELDGDSALANLNYPMAVEYYNQAINIYKEADALDKATLVSKKIIDVNIQIKEKSKEEQIDIANGYIEIADNHMENKKYENALENYILARDLFKQIKSTENITDVNKKIDLAKEKIEELKVLQKVSEGKALEDAAAKLSNENKFVAAIAKYREAQVIYQEANQIDKVLGVEEKIKKVDEVKVATEEKAKADEIVKQQQAQADQKAKEEVADKLKTAKGFELDGDIASSKKEYVRAIYNYEKAIEIYKEINNTENKDSAMKKIIEINLLIKSETRSAQLKVADDYINTGDSYYYSGIYDRAIDNYKSAQDIFKILGYYEKVVEINEKIKTAEKLL